MRPILAPFALCLVLASPGWAQEDGPSVLDRGIERMMRGLLQEMAPALRDLEGTLSVLEGVVGELERYEPPEILPNGDIIIRRKPDLPPDEPAPGDGEIEL